MATGRMLGLELFERFRQASELYKSQSEAQVNALVYSMGDQTDSDILAAFKLSDDEQQKQCQCQFDFDKHLVKKHNVISEYVQSEKTEGSGIC